MFKTKLLQVLPPTARQLQPHEPVQAGDCHWTGSGFFQVQPNDPMIRHYRVGSGPYSTYYRLEQKP
ncbi:MAG: hypothetical protein RBJ76_13250 [Stenomitos frigidus ULC029]